VVITYVIIDKMVMPMSTGVILFLFGDILFYFAVCSPDGRSLGGGS
jgi:hypothetical protein